MQGPSNHRLAFVGPLCESKASMQCRVYQGHMRDFLNEHVLAQQFLIAMVYTVRAFRCHAA